MRELIVEDVESQDYDGESDPVYQQHFSDLFASLKQSNGKVFSVELCANRRIDFVKLKELEPTFCSVTWHYKPSNYQQTVEAHKVPAIILAKHLHRCGFQVLLHLAARNLNAENALGILNEAKQIGIKNLFIIQGDKSAFLQKEDEKCDFPFAINLIRFIKETFKGYFSIGVAGYPDSTHLEDKNYYYLKEKVKAGADFIITQAIFEESTVTKFCIKCRNIGIEVPIIPAVYIFQNYDGLHKLSKFCDIRIPEEIQRTLSRIQGNSESVKNYSIHLFTKLFMKLFLCPQKFIFCIHTVTLNNFSSLENVYNKMFKISIERPIGYYVK